MYKSIHTYLYEDSLPSALPLPTKPYSLETDMLTGWRPKFLKSPISLCYNDETYSEISKKFHSSIYKGYRPADSFTFHTVFTRQSLGSYPYDFSDKSLTAYKFLNKNKSDPAKFGMTKKGVGQVLKFDSAFEGGNLDRVVMINPLEYDLYMRPDTNTSGHMHWFYFSVTGFGCLEKIKFNIVNFSRTSPLFRAGMRPKALSQSKFISKNSSWDYIGENVTFGYSKLNKFLDPDCKKHFYMLSFEFTPFDLTDKIWFATTTPYTFSHLFKVLKTVQNSDQYDTSQVDLSTLGKSMSLVDIPLLTITNPQSPFKKKIVVAIGRVHPSETVGSWVVEGFFRFIASHCAEARRLRDTFIFKIIPMCNPDGVIIGNSRTSLNGEDLNRCYMNPSDKSQPEAKLIKDFVQGLINKGEEIFMVIDFHGHFSKKGSFLYGPCFPLHDPNYFNTKILAKLLAERTHIFRYPSSRFAVEKGKDSTARMVIWKELGVVHTYTLETSYFGYINEDRDTVAFAIKDFYELAEKLALTIFECFVIQGLDKGWPKLRNKDKGKRDTGHKIRLEKTEQNTKAGFFENTLEWNYGAPVDEIEPLTVGTSHFKQRDREEVIQMIKCELGENDEESASAGSGSESDEVKVAELPKIERKKRNLSEISGSSFGCSESSQGKKMKLNEKFVKRIQKIKERRKRESKGSRVGESGEGRNQSRRVRYLEDLKFPIIATSGSKSYEVK